MTIADKSESSLSLEHLPRERIVLFMDILGFRKKIARMETEPNLYCRIKNILKSLQEEIRDHDDKGMPNKLSSGEDTQSVPQMTQFSDSIVISIPDPDETAAQVTVQYALKLAGMLMDVGIFIRGGIAQGWTYHEQNVLFGAGFLAAYELESRIARMPRIVVADEVIRLLPDYEREPYVWRDGEGCWFINTFSSFLCGRKKEEMLTDNAFQNEVVKQFKDARQHIQEELEEAKQRKRSESDRLEKYRWLANQFNAAVQETFQGMNVSVDTIEVS